MNITYNRSKILKLLNDFSNCTNLTASLAFDDVLLESTTFTTDDSIQVGTNSYDASTMHFCHYIHENINKKICHENDLFYLEQAKKEKKTIIISCHAGLCEIVTPIFLDNVIVGYIMCGMFIDAEREYSSVEKIKETAKRYSLNETTLLNLYNKLPVVSKSTVESALNILNICIQHILREHFLEVRRNELSAQIREYILENLEKNLTANHLCNVFFTNRQKLHCIFKEHFHDSVHNYIIKKRIEKAKTLLSKTNKTIDTIAFETGFPNYNYFIKIFKKRTGFSPLQFRKNFSNK